MPFSAFGIVGVIGAGTMGAGIAQVAAAAGHRVRLYDASEGAAFKGKRRIGEGLDQLVNRGRMARAESDALLERLDVADSIEALADTGLVIEAIVEDLDVKRRLFAQLETIVATDTILASNTSSISITALARDCKRPGQVVGVHFFNPAPVMKLVEVVSGVATSPDVAAVAFETVTRWGKMAVHAKSTPGFIVNRVARPYYAEALRLLEERVADPVTIDALMTQSGGFRMGPFELMDLIGNDVNYAVTLSVFNAYYQDPRFRPSIVQLELINAGRLGRKSDRGFYDYSSNSTKPTPATEFVSKDEALLDGLKLDQECVVDGVLIVLTDGRLAHDRSAAVGRPVILHDLAVPAGKASRLAFSASGDVQQPFIARFVATLTSFGLAATRLPDWPGLVVMRTVAMLANEGFEAALQGVADEVAIDTAMRYGVNYPYGPCAWARQIGLSHIVAVLDNLNEQTKDMRYRASLGLRAAARA
jgi:3-hydroxybutyryl-CoA dehydrogenase